MKKIKKFFIYNLIIICMLMSLVGCSKNENKDDEKSKSKTEAEINYVEDSVLKILNKYAKGEYIKEDNSIDWKTIQGDEKNLLNSLDTIVLDLSELNVKNEDIVKLSDEINNLIVVTSEENEVLMVSKLKDIYSLIPSILQTFEKDQNVINKKKIRELILSCYSLANEDKWDECKTEITNLENKYKEMMNDLNYAENNSYNLNNVYVLIEEFKNSIELENKELINLKYVNLIEKT